MADVYGGLQIPIPTGASPPTPFATGDVLVGWMADFIKAVLNTYAATAWASIAPGSTPPVNQVFLHNPEDDVFKEQALPALYVFADDSLADHPQEWLASDYRFSHTLLHAWWVLPNATQEKRALRYAFPRSVIQVIDNAIERMRDPAWVVSGDPDPQAAAYGSQLWKYAGWSVCNASKAKRRTLKIPAAGQVRNYEMLAIEFAIEELLVRDITIRTQPQTELQATFQIPDQDTGLGPLVTGQQTIILGVPNDISGLVFDFVASAGVVASGNVLSTWTDRGPNALVATAVGSPVVNPGISGGQPVVTLDGVSAALTVPASASIHPTTGLTVFAVYQVRTASVPQVVLSCTSNATPTDGYALVNETSLDNTLAFAINGLTHYGGDTATSAGQFYVLVGVYDRSHVSLYINGQLAATQSAYSAAVTYTSNPQLVIGAINNGSGGLTGFSPVDVAEVGMYGRALSSAEIAQLTQMLLQANQILVQ